METSGTKRKLQEADIEDNCTDWDRSFVLHISYRKLQEQQGPIMKYKPCIKSHVFVERPLRHSVLLQNTIRHIRMNMPQNVHSHKESSFISHSSPLPGIDTFFSPMTPLPVPVMEEESEDDCERGGYLELESSLTELLPCRPTVQSTDSPLLQNKSFSCFHNGQASPEYSYSTMPCNSIPSSSACSSDATQSTDGLSVATTSSSLKMAVNTQLLDSQSTSTNDHSHPSVSVLSDAGDSNSVTFQWPYSDITSSFEGSDISDEDLKELFKYFEELVKKGDTEQNSTQLPPRRPS